MVYLEDATCRLFTSKDPATLTSLIHLMPDISYDYALKNLRATAHEVSWVDSYKKDLVWDNCADMIAAGMTISEKLRVDSARTLAVFMRCMFELKLKKDGPDLQQRSRQDEGSASPDSLREFDLRGREDVTVGAKGDEADTCAAECAQRGNSIVEGADGVEPTSRDREHTTEPELG